MFQPAYILIATFALLFVLLLAATLYLISKISRIEKLVSDEGKLERHTNRLIGKKIDKEASEKIDKFINTAYEHLELEIDKQIKSISDRASAQAEEMTNFVKDQQESIVKETQLMVANIVLKAQKEAEEYRANQIDRVESQISSIVAVAAKEVLGRVVTVTEQEDLVKQALEKAKKDRFFAA